MIYLPTEFESLKKVEELALFDNRFGNDENNLNILIELTSLKKLDLKSCKLTSLPDAFKSLEVLEELDLRSNNLNNDNNNLKVLDKIPTLKKLYLGSCKLTSNMQEKIKNLLGSRLDLNLE